MNRTSDRPTVLVVDDEPALADLYADLLTDSYSVRTAYSGTKALDELDEAVDVVLLDRRMPNLSGDDVLTEIHVRDLSCRIAMITAVEPDFDIVEMPFDDYLTKPVGQDDLRGTVERLLTLSTYDEQIREYFACVSKKAVLEAEKPSDELEASEEYARLERRIADTCDELDSTLEDFDASDSQTFLRGLTRDPSNPTTPPDHEDA